MLRKAVKPDELSSVPRLGWLPVSTSCGLGARGGEPLMERKYTWFLGFKQSGLASSRKPSKFSRSCFTSQESLEDLFSYCWCLAPESTPLAIWKAPPGGLPYPSQEFGVKAGTQILQPYLILDSLVA